jgi:hypothetical protein
MNEWAARPVISICGNSGDGLGSMCHTIRAVHSASLKVRLKNPDLRALIPGAGVNRQLDASEAVPNDTELPANRLKCS